MISCLRLSLQSQPQKFKLPSRLGKTCSLTKVARKASGAKLSESLASADDPKATLSESEDDIRAKPRASEGDVHRNEIGVQMLSKSLKDQLFPGVNRPPSSLAVQISKEHLRHHGLFLSESSTHEPISLNLPPLLGSNLPAHFESMARLTCDPYLALAKTFATTRLRERPDRWCLQSGWTKYNGDGSFEASPNGPVGDMICFDVETLPKIAQNAVMACAASEKGWWAWISPYLLGETDDPNVHIPFPSNNPRIFVGHNIGYDRARMKEEYSIHATQNRFLDTMSLHIALKGISSPQRAAFMSYQKSKKAKLEHALATERIMREFALANGEIDNDSTESDDAWEVKRWEDLVSGNSLKDAYAISFPDKPAMEKEVRNYFMDPNSNPETLQPILQELLTYCSNDVFHTHELYCSLLPRYFEQCPSPVSFKGMLEMGSSFLPVSQDWPAFIKRADDKYKELEDQVQDAIERTATSIMETYPLHSKKWEADPWLCQLDWSPKPARKSTSFKHLVAREVQATNSRPKWLLDCINKGDMLQTSNLRNIVPHLIQLRIDGHPLYQRAKTWYFRDDAGDEITMPHAQNSSKPMTSPLAKLSTKLVETGRLTSDFFQDILEAIVKGNTTQETETALLMLRDEFLAKGPDNSPWSSNLDWTYSNSESKAERLETKRQVDNSIASSKPTKGIEVMSKVWPKWYWDCSKPSKGDANSSLTLRSRITPLILRLMWNTHPLTYSKEHGWLYRISESDAQGDDSEEIEFDIVKHPVDSSIQSEQKNGVVFRKIPHPQGSQNNVGNPLSKGFIKHFESGVLASGCAGDSTARLAIDANAMCSYWVSARERVKSQIVVFSDDGLGVILPQVVTMGTVTRRAVERTWLAAANAKKNRLGSELKSQIKAPLGYKIIGADVDSEELWICSVLGDAQFGLHGAGAVGWMTLEGTKEAGTDLHTTSGRILGIDRDQAKVFNYSRLYGAGQKHAKQLLTQANPQMSENQAAMKVTALYKRTKGSKLFNEQLTGKRFWHGGSESFVFNKLEQIACMSSPKTPALKCGLTVALRKENMPATSSQGQRRTPHQGESTLHGNKDFMTSRVNWAVQSSGVDYLHMLITAVDYLVTKYEIKSRYMISLHDEIRYLCADEDASRLSLALQIANLWTRSMFAYQVGLDNLPQGVAFFSDVDVDFVLRKDIRMDCVTPSSPIGIPPGKKYGISETIKMTNGTLMKDGSGMPFVPVQGEHDDDEDWTQYRSHPVALACQAAIHARYIPRDIPGHIRRKLHVLH